MSNDGAESQDVVARTAELLEDGQSVQELLHILKDEGFNPIEAISGLIRGAEFDLQDAKAAVFDGPWADQHERTITRTWIAPPEPPSAEVITRLREACRVEPRISEAWIAGARITRPDGSSHDETEFALILDPPLDPPKGEKPEPGRAGLEFVAKLDAAMGEPSKPRSWLFITKEILAGNDEQCVQVYSRESTDAEPSRLRH